MTGNTTLGYIMKGNYENRNYSKDRESILTLINYKK